VVSKPNKTGETRMTSIHMNGGGSYRPALVNGGCSDGTAPKKGRQLYSFQITLDCHKTNKDSWQRTFMLSPPNPQTGPRKRLWKFQPDGLSDQQFKKLEIKP
jgi:hypothetical protein